MSQYRSHGYLFNQMKSTILHTTPSCLNTVLTVISLILKVLWNYLENMSQYRSHGYLFNHVHFSSYVYRCWSQYRSHGYLFNHG